MKTHTKTLLAALTASAMIAGSASAASVLWVDSTTTGGAAGRAPEASWVSLLAAGGHTLATFDESQAAFNLTSQASKDYVNSFDLIIVAKCSHYSKDYPSRLCHR